MIPMMPALVAGAQQGWKITLTGATVEHDIFNSFARADFRVNADGTTDESTGGGGFIPINSATDWIIPNTVAGSFDAYIRWNLVSHSGVGSTVTTAPIAEDTWVLMDGVTNYTWLNTASAGDIRSSSIQVSIHWNNSDTFGVDTETGSYIITADGRAL